MALCRYNGQWRFWHWPHVGVNGHTIGPEEDVAGQKDWRAPTLLLV